VARESAPQLPVIASFSFDEDAHGSDATSALVAALRPLGVAAIGVNCGSGPQAALEVARRLLEAGAPVVSVMPNAGLPERVGGRLLREAGVDFANITDSALARLRMGVLSCAALVQQQVGLEAIAHFTTRDRNVMAIQSELIGAHALGIRNVLCLRGDPPRVGDYPNATAVWDVNAVGLITILANMNRGLDANGA